MDVLLVHGLGRTSLSLRRLGRELGRSGHRVQYFHYFAWAEDYPGILARLERRLAALQARDAPYAVIGHSLGGLLLRQALGAGGGRPPAHFITLATPLQVPRMARRAMRTLPFRVLMRDCGAALAAEDTYAALPDPRGPWLAVAGTRGLHGARSPFGTEENDGVVALSEVAPNDGVPLVTVRATHTFIMNHPEVRRLIRRTLAS